MASELEQRLGYSFRNHKLLEHALTHSSYANENRKDGLTSNERLEFLGDSVLGFVVASYLFKTYPDRPEGELTKLRAALVCEKSLAAAAAKLKLGAALLLGHGEEHGGRKSSSITADAMESVLAAAYLDGGLEAASGIIHRLILGAGMPDLQDQDYKTRLQELVQREKHQQLSYQLTGERGPDHDKHFSVCVLLNDKVVGCGEGRSKKHAEQAAAAAAIQKLFPEEA
ncbi:MAG: ribonuclease III [Clostridiales bacterium]|nr:ribonuclease III [Clostridiales bacterium]